MTTVAGTQLHVRDDGPKDAPAIILLHGFGSSLHTWEAWAQALKGTTASIRLDLPGSGLSPPDPTGDYTDARAIALILVLMDQLGIAQGGAGRQFDWRAHCLELCGGRIRSAFRNSC